MAAMPLLNRQPEVPYIKGLLVVLGLILLLAVVRYHSFFAREILGLR
jgi:hypothetical protein